MKHSFSSDDLLKYKEILLAGLDYYIKIYNVLLEHDQDEKSTSFYKVAIEHYEWLKINVTELYQASKFSTLKKWFKDISEQALETRDLNYQKYIEEATGYHIDIFANFFSRIDKIMQNGEITTNSEYRDAVAMTNNLSEEASYADKVIKLDKLIFAYSDRKRSQTKRK